MSGVAGHLSSGGFRDPGAQSTEARRLVEDAFDSSDREGLRAGSFEGPSCGRSRPGAPWSSARATVAASLVALTLTPLSFLRSFAYAGISVVIVAALASLVVLPAALAALGPRMESWALFRRPPKEPGEGFWHQAAMRVMRRPLVIGGSVVCS